ncbi:hypothetical protein [Halomarina ordinaria]|uniref:DUF8048 domain-containing protein n=1 Tax=Halomarina ordinaria TaxID=3033939 RepID=A0ABD5UFV4_9EURY|nr:hypothetical protein [Halomarina sp. PSRA2]
MNPIDGNALLLAAAKASVGPQLLPDLVEHVQADLGPRLEDYRRRYELVAEDDEACVFFVEAGHWDDLRDRLDLDRREGDAVERAHTEHLRRVGSVNDRRDEFETALDIREVVVVGKEG